MARECKLRKNVSIEAQKQWNKMEAGKHKDQIFLEGKFYHYCYSYHKFGHKVADYKTKGKEQNTKIEDDKGKIRRTPHGNMWNKNSDYEDLEETQISNISEVSKDDNENNSAMDENEDEGDEQGYSDCGILF